MVHLLQLSEADAGSWRAQVARGDHSNMPGMVRASFGCYNAVGDVNRLADMLERIARGAYRGKYRQLANGEYVPEGADRRGTCTGCRWGSRSSGGRGVKPR